MPSGEKESIMKLLIVGGVAAGMSTAARARRLSETAEIVVLERGKHVSFANCGLPYHIGGVIRERDQLLLQTPQSLKASLNLDVRVGHEAIKIDRSAHTVEVRGPGGETYAEKYDKLVVCPGSSPVRPPLPGIESKRIHVLRNIDDMDRIRTALDAGGGRAVVIGGGYIGVEMAENLKTRGVDVDVVEMLNQVMPPFDREMVRDLEDHMRSHGIRLHLGTAAAAFRETGGGMTVELKNGSSLECDFVIVCVGVRPETKLASDAGLELGPRGGIRVNDRMETSDPDIYAAGDAVEVADFITGEPALIPLAGPANRQGRIVADNIFGKGAAYRATQGTAIVKVFDMTAGCTGASEKVLLKAGRDFRKVYIHPGGHAGYYPGTAPMHVKLLFAPGDGRILGAQVAGFDGVDKRVDVFATAIRAGMTVSDLKDLELAYAPPYGSAKDPVNMAGFVAENLMKGVVEFWYAEDFPAKTEQGTLLDVRSTDEYETWHVPGAINIPLAKLRGQLGKLSRANPVFVYCKVGFRSYLAYRILKQNGFERASTLAGGATTFCRYQPANVCGREEPKPMEFYADAGKQGKTLPAAKRTLDCCGLQCPGPIQKLKETVDGMQAGDEVVVCASDPGFAADAPAWCRRQGHEVLGIRREGAKIEVSIRKGRGAPPAAQSAGRGDNVAIVVFSGDMDKVLAAFVIANGAVAMGCKVTMFFTFWGLNALRKAGPQAGGKGLLDRMFGMMMPRGARALKLSKMHMMGMGTELMKQVMATKRVPSLPEMIETARGGGVALVACTMSMDVMGLKKEELLDGIEFGGVASFLESATRPGPTLFI
jgi:NADPH-dependent 2,4-dienoyl-CoA reductase/sulfur reductase-like enzyme/peroxiredoxin family protein/rhodanese-related sulfurtransferase/TusA-related sulfurtransferase